MIDSTKTLSVALVLSGVRTPRAAADPAIDRSDLKAAYEALKRYSLSRTEEDRARIPLVPGGALTLFELAPLTIEALMFVEDGTAGNPLQRNYRAFLCACRSYTKPGQPTKPAPMSDQGTAFQYALPAWAQEVASEFGADAINELGSIAVNRAHAPRNATDPFVPPPGLEAR